MQTDAASHNIVSLTMLGAVGTGCVVHASERNNCHHYWPSSKDAMHSGTVTLTMRVRERFHEANIIQWFHTDGRNTLRWSQNSRNVGTCRTKSLIGFKLYVTSANNANIVVVPCKRTQHVALGPTMLPLTDSQILMITPS